MADIFSKISIHIENSCIYKTLKLPLAAQRHNGNTHFCTNEKTAVLLI